MHESAEAFRLTMGLHLTEIAPMVWVFLNLGEGIAPDQARWQPGAGPRLGRVGLCPMKTKTDWIPGPGIRVAHTERQGSGWMVSGTTIAASECCPECAGVSTSYHGWKVRMLQDLPVQGLPVSLRLRQLRWRCRNPRCARKTFVSPLPESAPPFARRTRRVTDLALVLVHATGGRPTERLMKRLGLPQSDDTMLRSLKRQRPIAATRRQCA